MIFSPISLAGAYVIDLEKRSDDHGFFASLFDGDKSGQRGLISQFSQVNNSLIARKATLRGMHYQLSPRRETKLVRCVRGAFFDVILDLRKDSATFGQSFGAELTAENRRMMYVPKGFAHSFLTLVDDTEALYFVDEIYSLEHQRCVRYDDPTFKMFWPGAPAVISEKDKVQRDFDPAWHLGG
jgi:dTDP-4-dehydrorhamnose 3,5-epimerase